MLEDFVKLIPRSLINTPGEDVHTGRPAFAGPSDLYIIGYHPGGNPDQSDTVGERLDQVLNHKAVDWSAYLDESWDGLPVGKHRIQRRLAHLFGELGLNLRATPASHLIFQCWEIAGEPAPAVQRQWADDCWPFHQAVIDQLEVKVLVCLGRNASGWVLKKHTELTGAKPQQIDSFTAKDKARWSSYAYRSGDRYILALTHPIRASWINPNSDPTELVKRTLGKVRG